MYLKKVKLQANKPNSEGISSTRVKLVFQESPINSMLGGMALKTKEGERFTVITLEEGAKHPMDHEDVLLAGCYIIPVEQQLADAIKRYPTGADYSEALAFGEQVVTKSGEVIPNLFEHIVL